MAAPAETPPGFKRLCIKFDEKCLSTRQILFKENKTRCEDLTKPSGRTLLLLNIPPFCDEVSVKEMFSKFGDIESVTFKKNLGGKWSSGTSKKTVNDLSVEDEKFFPSKRIEGYRYGFVVYKDADSVAAAMNSKDRKNPLIMWSQKKPALSGMSKWVKAYCNQFPDKKSLQDNVDSYMIKYDAAVEKVEQEEAKAGEEADEHGWIKVTRKGKNPVILRTEANQVKARAREKLRRKKKELLNAYSYQIRESKRQKIAELRKKFEDDKERVQAMRDARRFRPF